MLANASAQGRNNHSRGGVFKTALAIASAALILPATVAAAEETEPPTEPPTITACGSTLTVEELKANFNERLGETGFAVSGNLVLSISDEDSSVVVRLPGRITGEFTETSGLITQTGRTLLVPDPAFPFLAEAIARAGLPELPVIDGRVVFTETYDPVTGAPTVEVTSFNGHVTDLCELLAR